MNYKIFIPSGNPTALVWDENFTPKDKKLINDKIMKAHPFVEQVGFISGNLTLDMAGGEQCVNALRSAGLCYMNEFNLKSVKMLSCGEEFECGMDEFGVYVDGKFGDKFSIKKLDSCEFIVSLSEISHIISLKSLSFKNDDELKDYAFSRIKEHNLNSLKASGFVLLDAKLLKPVVYVRDIDTLFYETACGSGTLAASCVMKSEFDTNSSEFIQPSGKLLRAQIFGEFDSFRISGEVIEYKINQIKDLTLSDSVFKK